jgi:hypothetical protein
LITSWAGGRVVVAAIDVDVLVEVDDEAVEVDVVGGINEVVVDSPEPVEVQALKTSSAEMATPATHGGRVRPPIPIDQRRELKSLPHNPSSRIHPTRPKTQVTGRTREVISSST